MQEVNYLINSEGFIEHPEITDAKLVNLEFAESNLHFAVQIWRSGAERRYRISCEEICAMRIDGLTGLNISLDFYASSDSSGRIGLLNGDLIESAFGGVQNEKIASKESAIRAIVNGDLILFGNEPSCGCEIAVVCKRVHILSI